MCVLISSQGVFPFLLWIFHRLLFYLKFSVSYNKHFLFAMMALAKLSKTFIYF